MTVTSRSTSSVSTLIESPTGSWGCWSACAPWRAVPGFCLAVDGGADGLVVGGRGGSCAPTPPISILTTALKTARIIADRRTLPCHIDFLLIHRARCLSTTLNPGGWNHYTSPEHWQKLNWAAGG